LCNHINGPGLSRAALGNLVVAANIEALPGARLNDRTIYGFSRSSSIASCLSGSARSLSMTNFTSAYTMFRSWRGSGSFITTKDLVA
jgi:hypothetical protein